MLRRLDGARTGGCSHLLVVARELGSWSFPQVVAWETRGLKPPSSCSWKKKEVGASNECNSSRHIRKNILWFSPNLGFHVKHGCTVYVCDCLFITSHYWIIILHWYNIWRKKIIITLLLIHPPLSNPTIGIRAGSFRNQFNHWKVDHGEYQLV